MNYPGFSALLRQLGRWCSRYFVEIATGPVAVVAFGAVLFGRRFWDDPAVFWSALGVTSLILLLVIRGNFWVRDHNVARFSRLEDWSKRLTFSVLGYLVVDLSGAALALLAFYLLSGGQLVPDSQQLVLLLVVCVISMLAGATAHEAIIYSQKWRAALVETEQLEKLYLETRFQSLQNQLNPHFLFNSLNVLSSLIGENPRRAEDFVDELSNVYRYLLRTGERELVTVEEELRFVRSFFHLLKTRHDTGISLEVNVPPAATRRHIPALALQILLENAVKHNEISPEKPLHIEIAADGESLLVRNNLQRKTARSLSNHVGLDNLRQRYELLNQPGFSAREEAGFFCVQLPLITAD